MENPEQYDMVIMRAKDELENSQKYKSIGPTRQLFQDQPKKSILKQSGPASKTTCASKKTGTRVHFADEPTETKTITIGKSILKQSGPADEPTETKTITIGKSILKQSGPASKTTCASKKTSTRVHFADDPTETKPITIGRTHIQTMNKAKGVIIEPNWLEEEFGHLVDCNPVMETSKLQTASVSSASEDNCEIVATVVGRDKTVLDSPVRSELSSSLPPCKKTPVSTTMPSRRKITHLFTRMFRDVRRLQTSKRTSDNYKSMLIRKRASRQPKGNLRRKIHFTPRMGTNSQKLHKEIPAKRRSLRLQNQLPSSSTTPTLKKSVASSKTERQQMAPEEFNSKLSAFLRCEQNVPNFKSGDFLINKTHQNKTENYPIWKVCDDNKLQRFGCMDCFGKLIHMSESTNIAWPKDLKTGYQLIKVKPFTNVPGCETVEVLSESQPKCYKRVEATTHILPANSLVTNMTSPLLGTSSTVRESDTVTPKHDKNEKSSVNKANKISSDMKSEEVFPTERVARKAKSSNKKIEKIMRRKQLPRKAKNEEIFTRERVSRIAKEQAKKVLSNMIFSDKEEFVSLSPDEDSDADPGWDPKIVTELKTSLLTSDQSDSEEERPAEKRRRMVSRSTGRKTYATAGTMDQAKDSVGTINQSPPCKQKQVNIPVTEMNQISSKNEEVVIDQQEHQMDDVEPGDFLVNKSDENRMVGYPVWRLSEHGTLQKFEYIDISHMVIHKAVHTYTRWCTEVKKNYKPIKVKPLTNKEGIETIRVLPEHQTTSNHIESPVNHPSNRSSKPCQATEDILVGFFLNKEDEDDVNYPIWRQATDGTMQKFAYVEMSDGKIIHKSVSTFLTCSEDEKQNFKPIKVKALTSNGGIDTVKVLPGCESSSINTASEPEQENEGKRRKIMNQSTETVQTFFVDKKDKNEEIITRERASRIAKEQAKKVLSNMIFSDEEEFASLSPDEDSDADPGWDPKIVTELKTSLLTSDQSDSEEERPAEKRRHMVSRSTGRKTHATAGTMDQAKDSVGTINQSPPCKQKQVNIPVTEMNQVSSNNKEVVIDQQENQMDDVEPGDFLVNKSDENRMVGYPVWRLSEHGTLQKFEYIDISHMVIHKAVHTYTRWCTEVKKNYKPIKVKPLTNKEGIETIRVLPEHQTTSNHIESPVNHPSNRSSKPHQDTEDILVGFFLNKEDEDDVNYPIWRQATDGTMQKFAYVEMSNGKIIHKSVSTFLTCSEDEKQNFKPIKVKALTSKGGIHTVKVLPVYEASSTNTASEPEQENEGKRRKIMNQSTETVQTFFVDKKDERTSASYPIWRLGTDSQLQKFDYVDMGTIKIHKSVSTYIKWSEEIKNNYKQINVKFLSNKNGVETFQISSGGL